MMRLFFLTALLFTQLGFAAEPDHKVIIIGAGIAGLETASYLHSHGINDFIILEASDHIGGRAYTINWNDIDVPLGATWIHGVSSKNPISKLVEKWHIETMAYNDNSGALYQANGKELPDSQLAKFDRAYFDFMDFVKAKRLETNSAKQYEKASLSDFAVEYIKVHNLDQNEQAGFIFELVDRIEENYAADITKLSALWYNGDEEFSKIDQIPIHGYKQIIEGLSKDFKDKIVLKQIVKEINYEDKNFVTVSTANGKKFTAQYVVSTLPVGVLKQGSVKFIPKLPEDKLTSLKHLNMGIMNKVIMNFPKVFWDKEQYINYIAPAYWSGEKWVNKGVWSLFYNYNHFIKKPMLFALVAGDFAVELENHTDSEIIEGAMNELRKIYGEKIPYPTSYIITRWGKNPFSRGSFSSLKPGALADGDDYWNMAQPIDNRLFFAGEATNDQYPSTVYGAYLSGDRVATEILALEKVETK